MTHPVIWPKKTFFYPIGNTVPSCLTHDLAPEVDADILLLGCGDPRSILYTIHSDHDSCKNALLSQMYMLTKESKVDRKLDFTCCDAEPAILARNILLFTMVADNEPLPVIWSMFYHFFLDDASLGHLLGQCRKLLQFSSDLQTWGASKYGSFLRFCTERSLAEIRRHWVLYLEMETMPAREKNLLKNNFIAGMKTVKSKFPAVHTAAHSAGPFIFEALDLGPKHFREFWSTGVTVGISGQNKPYPHLNPTFVHSAVGTKFNVHYGTDPIVSFHLASILTSVKDAQTPSTVGLKELVEGARQQFFSLCSSFKNRLSLPSANLTIRFFVGDALAFCRGLHCCGDASITETGVYAYAWGGTQISFNVQDYSHTLTRRAPLTFNVIDTSNLTDHLGLINILLVTVPLLQRNPSSAIYTDTLISSDGPSHSAFVSKACADIPTLALFIGVAPLPYLSHFTSRSDKHGILLSPRTGSQLPQSISWKFPLSAIPGTRHDVQISSTVAQLVCDASKLARFLFSIYCNMFAQENTMDMFKNPLFAMQSFHYTRSSFVALLELIKMKAPTGWDQTMDLFISLVASNTSLMMGLHHFQDLICQLHLRDLFTMDTLQPAFVESLRSPRDCFHGWKDVPPVVCVVLKVPRQNIKILENMDPDEIGTPALECHTNGSNFNNIHTSLQFVFGDIRGSTRMGESAIEILEDYKGWNGSSDLLVTFYMPSWILLREQNLTFGLHIHVTPASMGTLCAKLGMFLKIYSTTLVDNEHVYLARERPGNVGELDRLRSIASLPKSRSETATEVQAIVEFDKSGGIASTLTMRHVITAPDAQKSLSNLAPVVTKPISDSTIEVAFDGYKHLFVNPFAVRGSLSKTRIARKSFYIEVETPLRPDYENFFDLSLSPFPISREGQLFNLFNIHYLNLNRLPALKLPVKHEKLQWLPIHLGMTLSKNEKTAKEKPTQQDRGTLVNLKESIAAVFVKWAGVEKGSEDRRFTILGLYNPTAGIGNYTLIFVNDIRLDLASHTIVADACVIPLSEKNMSKLQPALVRIGGRTLTSISTLDDETRLWKLLLPVLAERCRTWKHLPTCEYLVKGIPACIEGFEESPLCSCGKGKDLGSFGEKPQWKEFHSEATRIALSPLFSSSFTESAIEAMKADLEKPNMDTQCANCSGPGNPTLLSCSACKKIKYCSRACQKSHWKTHKLRCSSG